MIKLDWAGNVNKPTYSTICAKYTTLTECDVNSAMAFHYHRVLWLWSLYVAAASYYRPSSNVMSTKQTVNRSLLTSVLKLSYWPKEHKAERKLLAYDGVGDTMTCVGYSVRRLQLRPQQPARVSVFGLSSFPRYGTFKFWRGGSNLSAILNVAKLGRHLAQSRDRCVFVKLSRQVCSARTSAILTHVSYGTLEKADLFCAKFFPKINLYFTLLQWCVGSDTATLN